MWGITNWSKQRHQKKTNSVGTGIGKYQKSDGHGGCADLEMTLTVAEDNRPGAGKILCVRVSESSSIRGTKVINSAAKNENWTPQGILGSQN